jgi:hypothetical protein
MLKYWYLNDMVLHRFYTSSTQGIKKAVTLKRYSPLFSMVRMEGLEPSQAMLTTPSRYLAKFVKTYIFKGLEHVSSVFLNSAFLTKLACTTLLTKQRLSDQFYTELCGRFKLCILPKYGVNYE